ncbi:hypothetical protein D3C80_1569340 [compost metagenome]
MPLRASSSAVRASTFFTLDEKLRMLSSDMTRLMRFRASTVWARTVPDPLSSSAMGLGWLWITGTTLSGYWSFNRALLGSPAVI